MKKRTIRKIFNMVVVSISIILFPGLSPAQEEPSCVPCGEVNEPVLIYYAEHTCECQISPITDTDIFIFFGEAGDHVLINLTDTSGSYYFLPRLRVWDDELNVLNNTTGDAQSIYLVLPKTGTYTIVVSDNNISNSGTYVLQLERIYPISGLWPCIDYDSPEEDEINPVTDIDFFTFEGRSGTLISINLTDTSGSYYFLPRLRVWDDELNVLNNTTGDAQSISLELPKTGTYTIAVSDNNISNYGTYVLQTACIIGPCPLCTNDDQDSDGVKDEFDNCPDTPNGPNRGTCTAGDSHKIARECYSDGECGIDGFCSMNQEDTDEDGSGDACEICEGDLDCDDKCDAIDLEIFLTNFGRNEFNEPCTNDDQCPGDFSCDEDVDAEDVPKLLECLGRSPHNNPCFSYVCGPWCVYEE